ncbi:glycosyltransferase family 2 protein [Hyphomonas sp. UBA5107]|jgi:GT2 family glycosyltransferase|uniref:glycosyltransferase family 2 protein n=1 Tax=Hyphomonas sp. UBA5107 TaxID=1946636 RepID=UPI000EE4574A|nr:MULTISPECIES: glycosyltransferase family 2 protein [unclassified Hyphomonas]HCN91977.1 glycosyltransferase family 2 protein [Hyphomonas sp.]|tara:strand:+ start:681 stop:1721 length:1041 start_codon:yes stop_codon:yes gene_type:complete
MVAISVIIVNYNGGAFLQQALDSLRAQTFRDFEVLLVDNASTDGSMETLNSEGVPGYRILPQTENLGFAAGNNVAARLSDADWLVLFNPDAIANPDWLERVVSATQRNPCTNMFACAQYALEDPAIMDGAGDCYLGLGIPWRGGFGLRAEPLAEGECFSPCGASAVFRRSVFDAHGGFDERFFCYCEDVDLGYRMRLAGERCVFVPDAIIRHAGSGISGRASEFAIFHGTRNRIWTYAKNTPALMLWLTLPGHVAITLAILLRGFATGRAGPTWRGIQAGLAGLGTLKKDKRFGPPKRVASLGKIASAMAWNPKRLLDRRPVIRPLEKRPKNTTGMAITKGDHAGG